ncbi:hypothetical protein PG991_010727 [Apiospora marii]|uniref:Ketoreductase domain-containing protein n=1 Tax=Apiospora marii TaxID=335849 RepID=A0ABR1RE78_9PEZI
MASSAAVNMANGRVHEGKLALITGSARSIGASIATKLAAQGANVCIIYKTPTSDEPAQKLAAELAKTHGVKAVPCRADITTKEGCATILKTAEASFPANKNAATSKLQVDILVHSAALFHAMPLEAVTVEDFDQVYRTNVLGPILLTQAVQPHLPHDRSGRVVLLSSVGSKVGLAYLTLYGGTKGAVESMTRTWSRELAERCTVNSVCVGSTHTDMFAHASEEAKQAIALFYPLTPLSGVREWDSPAMQEMGKKYGGRVAYPEEIAAIVANICSPDAAYQTGCLISANGGQWMSG